MSSFLTSRDTGNPPFQLNSIILNFRAASILQNEAARNNRPVANQYPKLTLVFAFTHRFVYQPFSIEYERFHVLRHRTVALRDLVTPVVRIKWRHIKRWIPRRQLCLSDSVCGAKSCLYHQKYRFPHLSEHESKRLIRDPQRVIRRSNSAG